MLDAGGNGGGRYGVAGVAVPAGIAERTDPRPRVVIVAESWGSHSGETATATRLVAGALALSTNVSVVSIDDRSDERYCPPRLRYDGVFPIYSVAAPIGSGDRVGAHGPPVALLPADLVRASLRRQAGAILPEVAAAGILDSASLPSTDALVTTVGLNPDAVVLAGGATFWMGDALPVGADRLRVVLLPLFGNDPVLSSTAFKRVLDPIDAIGAFSDAEFDRIEPLLAGDAGPRLHRVQIALPVNHLAAAANMAGFTPFGRFVLVISAFGDDPANGRCPPHDYLRHVFGHISVAEVRRNGWLVTGATGERWDPPWVPTRINLWRLMAGADVTLDLRSPGPIGREVIESLRFGTPVVVPDDSVPAEHAKRSNGGLWYRNLGEMVDCVRRLLADEALRSQLGASGKSWADRHHGDTDTFVETTMRLVLGSPAGASSPFAAAQPA